MQAHEWETTYGILRQGECAYIDCALSLRLNHPGQLSKKVTVKSIHRWIDDHFPFIVRLASQRRGEIPPPSVREIMKHILNVRLRKDDYAIQAREGISLDDSRFVIETEEEMCKLKKSYTQ